MEENFISFYEIRKKYNKFGCSNKNTLAKLEESGLLVIQNLKDRILYSEKDLKKYIDFVEETLERSVSLPELAYNLSGKETNCNNKKKAMLFAEEMGLEKIVLPVEINRNRDRIFHTKESIKKFKKKYISIEDAFVELGCFSKIETLRRHIKEKNIKVKTLLAFNSAIFIERIELNHFISADNLVLIKDARVQLDLSLRSFYIVLDEMKISTIRAKDKNVFIKKIDLEILLEIQKDTLKDIQKNYYDLSTIKELLNEVGIMKEKGEFLSTLSKVEIPEIIRTSNSRFKNKNLVYERTKINEYLGDVKREKENSALMNNANYKNILETFDELLINSGFDIKSYNSYTWQSWMKFIEIKLCNSNEETNLLKRKLVNLKNATILLFEFLQNKEIYNLNIKEISIAIFNDISPITYKQQYRHFFNLLNEELIERNISPIKIHMLNIRYSKTNENKELIYNFEEYQKIYKQINNTKFHLEKIKNEFETSNYSSSAYLEYWIYVLLHIITGLRKGDAERFACKIPDLRERFAYISEKNIYEMNLSEVQLDSILAYINLKVYTHSKNRKRAFIYCPEGLKVAFVYAVICYQLKSLNNADEDIDLSQVKMFSKEITHKFFDFKVDFKSRKMNKTLLTITNMIEAEMFENNSNEVSTFLRGHRYIESTNKYIKIPQDRIDQLTEEIYDNGFFGYLYEGMVEYIKDNNRDLIKEQKATMIKVIKNLFGDTNKLNNLFSDLLKIQSKKQNELSEYLESIDKNDIIENIKLIKSGIKKGKEMNYSCLYSECVSLGRECRNCIFSIPHFYSINEITKRFMHNMKSYKLLQYKEVPQGEKKRLYNFIIKDFSTIIEAIKKFGMESIEYLLEIEYKDLKTELLLLSEP